MINEYISYLIDIRGLSTATATAYGKDLRHFAHWAQEYLTDAHWSTITRDDIDAYIRARVSEGRKPATTNRALSAIAGIYGYFKRQGLLTESPCKYASRRKLAKTLPSTIPTGDLKEAYKAATGKTKLLLGILATTGLRIQEALNIRYFDVDTERGSIIIHGKGNTDRVVFIAQDWARQIALEGQQKNSSAYVFDWSQRDARCIIEKALRPFTTAEKVNPHTIRHTLATELAIAGCNVSQIATLLGHTHLETTQKYINAARLDLATLPTGCALA